MTVPREILIVGAGPTGLGAANRLVELGAARSVRVLERSRRVGGLASSFTDDAGFTWDIGGHVLFSHYPYYDALFKSVMRDEYSLIDRESWVRIAGTWVPYPFQSNIRHLPRELALDCLVGLIRAQSNPGAARSARNFGEFIDAVFGDGISRVFMRPYNFKVWAHPPEMMNKSWIGERVAVVDWERALRNLATERDDFGWGPNNRFHYPLHGGTGGFYRKLGDRVAAALDSGIELGVGLVSIDPASRRARFSDGSERRFDALVSTIPLDLLCTRVIVDAPRAIADAASRLRHSGGHMVGVGIRRRCPSTRSWMYFPETDCPFYRVTYLSNYSPNMTPDRATHYSLLCETSFSEFKPVDARTIVEETIRGLESCGLLAPGERADIVSTWRHDADYSYPIPTVDRDEILSIVIPWLEEHGIYSRGRFGMWKYEVANTDHSIMQGVELADRLIHGTPEKTIGLTYAVTADGRRGADHHRPAMAGSGEKRLTELKPSELVGKSGPARG